VFELDPAFIRPTYDSHSFIALPRSIAGLFGRGTTALHPEVLAGLPEHYTKVVVILADGFAWHLFQRFAGDHPALRRFTDRGTATRFTSQFPSTTAAHVTALHTGLEVGQSGIYEWQYYEPSLDAIIVPLIFSFAGTHEHELLTAAGVDPTSILPPGTLYRQLAAQGIASAVFQPKEFDPSAYSDHMCRGATRVGYRTLPEACVNLQCALHENTGPAYYLLYFDRIDTMAHQYGPDSPQIEAEIDAFLTTLERQFLSQIGDCTDTLVLLTADHGETGIDPATTLYLDRDPAFHGIMRYLKTDRAGHPLAPAGAPRDFFLHVHEEMLDEAHDFLTRRLAGRAAVYRTSDMIAAGFFGAEPPGEPFRARVGNLVILPHQGESVWWFEQGRFELHYYGYHGGLSPDELEIPLLAYAPS